MDPTLVPLALFNNKNTKLFIKKKTYYRIMIFNLIQSVFGALPKLTSIKTIHYTYCTCARVMEYIAFNV